MIRLLAWQFKLREGISVRRLSAVLVFIYWWMVVLTRFKRCLHSVHCLDQTGGTVDEIGVQSMALLQSRSLLDGSSLYINLSLLDLIGRI